jgi:steroid 5-alpha reductase family enzyme
VGTAVSLAVPVMRMMNVTVTASRSAAFPGRAIHHYSEDQLQQCHKMLHFALPSLWSLRFFLYLVTETSFKLMQEERYREQILHLPRLLQLQN